MIHWGLRPLPFPNEPMTTSAITPDIVGLDEHSQVFEDSPMTETEEKELVIVKTAITTAYADKLERDLAIGAGLLKIFRRKLYRGKDGGRSWKQWLEEESAELTAGRGSLGVETSRRLRGFYQFRVEVLQASSTWRTDNIALPSSPAHVRPLLVQLDTHPNAAVEMWKAACAQAGKGKVPTSDQVNRAAIAYQANAENEARRLSAAKQAALNKAQAARAASVPSAGSSEGIVNAAAHTAANDVLNGRPTPGTEPPDFSPEPPSNSIPAWELETHDDSVDAGAECRRITQAMNAAFRAVAELRGIIYSQTNKYGSDYLNFLRQVDAGVYSLNNIDDQVAQLGDDISFVAQLLNADVGEGELAQSTIDVDSIPHR